MRYSNTQGGSGERGSEYRQARRAGTKRTAALHQSGAGHSQAENLAAKRRTSAAVSRAGSDLLTSRQIAISEGLKRYWAFRHGELRRACPICNGKPHIEYLNANGYPGCRIVCDAPVAHYPRHRVEVYGVWEQDAVQNWNRRAK